MPVAQLVRFTVLVVKSCVRILSVTFFCPFLSFLMIFSLGVVRSKCVSKVPNWVLTCSIWHVIESWLVASDMIAMFVVLRSAVLGTYSFAKIATFLMKSWPLSRAPITEFEKKFNWSLSVDNTCDAIFARTEAYYRHSQWELKFFGEILHLQAQLKWMFD